MLKQSAKLKKIVLCSGLMAASTFAAAEDIQYGIAVPEVNAQTYVLMDYNSGAVLASLNPDQRQYPASLTKMMTSYVVGTALKQGKIHNEDMVTISETAWGRNFPDSSKMFLNLNQQVSVGDLNKGIIIVSGNDACVAVAEHISGTVANFVDTMNKYVQQFGLKNTNFTTPHGLDDPNQYSTARDMAIIGAHIIRDLPEEYKIYSEKEEGKYDIFEGTLIPAVIQNQINSDYKGRVLALVREDVYDSLSGNVLLIPKGSRILGEMLPLNTNGGLERIVTVWDRIILPNGDNIFMENFRGQDLTGIDGIEGKVNKRYFKKIASVVLASVFEGTIGVVSTLPEIMLRKYDTRDGVIYSDSGATAGRRIGDTLTETVNKEVEKVVTRPNTVTLPSGTKTNIVVQIDIKLPKYERVR